ncbi:MAG: alpha-N-arabinofuranosidase [Oscillospiraceae bacterium]|nr:alpha-N-arabinofuranosidase [Oscillospiraceae bacterium]
MKSVKMYVNAAEKISHINPEIYGHFSEHLGRCIYNGIYVGEDSSIPNVNGVRKDIIDAFKKIKMPVLRWPGGCFADEYHWKNGIGDKSKRAKMVNTNWGGITEDNSFGTHEFFDLCEELGCEPYLAGNVGSGTVRELSEWIEYITFDGISPMADLRRKNGREKPWKLKYLGIGNENWGCGGNMRVEHYVDLYRQYQSFCKNYSGNELYKIACGPGGGGDMFYDWTDKLMKNINPSMAKAITLHQYTLPTNDWNHKGDAVKFDRNEYYDTIDHTLYMDTLIKNHVKIMDRYDPNGEISLIVDEWGLWFDVEEGTNPGFLYQKNTMRDAVVAAVNLNIFNTHSKRVSMANLAQAVNVLQAIILTEGEKMVLTPTYHVFDMFKGHQNGELVYSYADEVRTGDDRIPLLSKSVSVKDGVMTVTLANCSIDDDAEISCNIEGFDGADAEAVILTADDVHMGNDIDHPDDVVIKPFEVTKTDRGFSAVLPKCSVVTVTLR